MVATHIDTSDALRQAIDYIPQGVAVFDRDLTSVSVETIPQARCVLTLVNGQVVWEAKP